MLDLLQTTSPLTASQTFALQNDADGNLLPSPGDTIRFTAVVANPNDAQHAAIGGIVFINPAVANAPLVAGSVTTTPGTVAIAGRRDVLAHDLDRPARLNGGWSKVGGRRQDAHSGRQARERASASQDALLRNGPEARLAVRHGTCSHPPRASCPITFSEGN